MENLSLEKFYPGIAELNKLATKYLSLKIKGPDDIDGYNKVVEAIKDLVGIRRTIETNGKEFRAGALAFQRDVIAKEKHCIAIVENPEIKLKQQKQEIDNEREMIQRRKFLPHRKQVLSEIEFSAITEAYNAEALPDEFNAEMFPNDNQIMQMNDEQFSNFVLDRKNAVIDAKTFLLQKREADAAKKRLADEAEANRKKELDEAREAGREEALQSVGEPIAEPIAHESPAEYQNKQYPNHENRYVISQEVIDLCFACCSIQPIIDWTNNVCEENESITMSLEVVISKQPGSEAKIDSVIKIKK